MVIVIAEVEVVHVVAVFSYISFVFYEATLVGPVYACTCANSIYPTVVSCLSCHNVWWSKTFSSLIIVGTEYVMFISDSDVAVLTRRMNENLKLPIHILNGE